MSHSKVDVGLYIYTERKDGYFHIHANPVLLNTEGAGSIRNVDNSYGTLVHGFYLGDLALRSQGNETVWSGGPNSDPKLYGWEVAYKPFVVHRQMALNMAKTLAKIDKGLDKLTDARGYAKSYGEFVARVAEILKAKKIVFLKGPSGGGWSYAEREHRFLSLGGGRTEIDRLEADWKKSVLPKEAEAACS